MNLFECKINYDRLQENGIVKNVTEPYLLEAESFTEAEAKIVDEIKPFISGEFTVADIKRRKFAEVILNETGQYYYKSRLFFITLDEKSGYEKKMGVNMLVQANTLKEAVDIIECEMKKTMIDYSFHSIVETAVMDLFTYKTEENGSDD